MNTIVKLNPSVVNRIAAGEIIHHPYNAVKELLENSLDAGAMRIQIHISNGGLGLIKIIDNGHGIKMADMPLVCERYATSKLKEFKDLDQVMTFGFRGEALASISQVAKVIIVSKPKGESYGYQATYQKGNILSRPKICASNYGTIISIQQLFDNTPIRKKALRSATEEENRILDVIKKYATHNFSIGFSLQKENKSFISETKANNRLERIQQLFGKDISSRLKCTKYSDSKCTFELYFHDMNEETHYKIDNKNGPFLIFVNNRLVESARIKKEVKQVYNKVRIGYKPRFVYLSINVKPGDVDVNIHSTKNEVHLLNEEQVIDKVTLALEIALEEALSTPIKKIRKRLTIPVPERETLNHYFKSVSPVAPASLSSRSKSTGISPETPPLLSFSDDNRKPYDNYFQDDDTGLTTDDYDPSNSGPHGLFISQQKTPSKQSNLYMPSKSNKIGVYLNKLDSKAEDLGPNTSRIVLMADENPQELESIMTIKYEIQLAEDKELTKTIQSHQCVCIFDDILAVIVSKDKYYLINYDIFSEECFYQIFIYKIGKLGKLLLLTPLPISSCISLFIPDATPDQLVEACATIVKHEKLLKSYYSIELSYCETDQEVYITCLPMVLTGHIPSLDKLPIFLCNIATQIDWDNEIDCLDALARELSSFYCCCSINQYDYLLFATHSGEFKVPRYLKDRGYIIQLNIPTEIMLTANN